ncbi:MAG: type II secretion system major pseudopilin GspG [Planctomycetaceae bacterium]|jgi:general secretion pathway protein G|nr:type II secretion system major pseudopilin GspG [Planctomycetaceae bacterium]
MKKHTKRYARRRGFTLIEVMIVLLIMLALAGLAVFSYTGTLESANRKNTLTYVKGLASALELYKVGVGQYPSTEQGLGALQEAPQDLVNPNSWAGPYLKDSAATEDPWGNPYQYVCPGNRSRDGFDVWSIGPDRVDGSDDDLGNWTKE